MQDAFGVSKGIESLPKYALKPKPGDSLRLARKGTRDFARDARSKGKGAFQAQKVTKAWKPVSQIGQMLHNRGAVKMAPIAGRAQGQTSAARMVRPTGTHTAAASPTTAAGTKTVKLSAPAKPAQPTAPPAAPKGGKHEAKGNYREKEGLWTRDKSLLRNPWVIGGAAATGAAGAGAGLGYEAGKKR